MEQLASVVPSLTDIAEQQNLNFNKLTLLNFRNGLTVFQIPPQRQAPNVVRHFMRQLSIIIFSLTIIACNNPGLQTKKTIKKSVQIPDTTNNFFAKLYDYPNYQIKQELTRQLNLDTLENNKTNTEIRIWEIGSNYNPQTLFIIKKKDTIYSIQKIIFYLNYNQVDRQIKIDSISSTRSNEKFISQEQFNSLKTENIWHLNSQSQMTNGQNYGCKDGSVLLTELSNDTRYKFLFYLCPYFHIEHDTTFKVILTFHHKVEKLTGNIDYTE
ncbi:MAG: hypothetical protein MUF43_14570 [Flavobacterium sp.]|nr:hypothetical protein [Flavobacterium sp.]